MDDARPKSIAVNTLVKWTTPVQKQNALPKKVDGRTLKTDDRPVGMLHSAQWQSAFRRPAFYENSSQNTDQTLLLY